MKKVLANEKGAVLLEGVIASTYILLLTAFVLSCGLALYHYLIIEDASRDTARQLALGSATTDAHSIVQGLAGPLVLGKREFTVSTEDLGDKIQVTTKYRSITFMPGIGAAFGGSPFSPFIEIPATATFKKEM